MVPARLACPLFLLTQPSPVSLNFFQELSADASKALPHPTFKSYVEYITNRQLVKFRPRDNPRDPNNVFELTLSIKMTYDEVARLVGEHLKTDPMKLRFYNHRVQPEGPYNDIKRTPGLLLESMLVPAAQHANRTSAAVAHQALFTLLAR